MITVKEIAQKCNVSPSTVSNILNGKKNVSEATRQKVLQVIKETGYQPNYFAQSMRKQSSRMIAVITEDLNEFSTSPIVEAVMAYCDDHDYRTVLMNLRMYNKWSDTWYDDEKKLRDVAWPIIQQALSIRVDGIIYVAGHCRSIDCIPKDLEIPVVFAYGISKNEKYPSIMIDDEKGGYDMTSYLIRKGHRRIGVIGGAAENLHTQYRMSGYRRALEENELSFEPALVCYGDWRRGSGYQIAQELLKKEVTALFCMNDNMAAGVYDYLYEQGIAVGKEISVVGYDNKEIAEYLRPALTTNELPLREIGMKTAEMTIRLLKEDKTMRHGTIIKVPCKMVERESVDKGD